jgi:UDP-N-acetylglucosamine 2-epimerase (non-hydrolysing)
MFTMGNKEKMHMHIHLIAAARPNFMKIAPLYHALKKVDWAEPVIVHTGQHYDLNMSDAFFIDLRLPDPDIHLGVGSGTHAEQTGKVMMAYEKILIKEKPDLVIVVGDVNSTMAATIAAVKLGIKVAHLEAGLRSFDRSMPEEINRLITDSLADCLWTPSPDGDENLLREGVPAEKIHRVGNIMLDSFEMLRDKIEAQNVYQEYGLESGAYGLVTLHRPSNVDNPDALKSLCASLERVSAKIPLLFPVHPRTQKNLVRWGLFERLKNEGNIILTAPESYIRFMNLVVNCRAVITDSGGIQEETTYLGIPCLTLRPNTERPITVSQGSNRLCKTEALERMIDEILSTDGCHSQVPEMWDGRTAQRVVASIEKIIKN